MLSIPYPIDTVEGGCLRTLEAGLDQPRFSCLATNPAAA